MTDDVPLLDANKETFSAAADYIGTTYYQRVKISWGVDGSAVDASDTNPFPAKLTNIEKAEDAASSSGDKGIMALAVRNDTRGALAGTDGDYAALQLNASGELRATLETLEKAEDAAHSSGDKGIMSLAVRNDTLGTTFSGTNGDYTPIAVASDGAVFTRAQGMGASGSTVAGNPILIAGSDGANARNIITDSTGKIQIVGSYAEDAAASNGDYGIYMLAVRNSALSSTTSTDGDYSSIAVDARGGILGASDYAEDAAHTSGDIGKFILAVRNDNASTTLAGSDGDYSPIAVGSKGQVYTATEGRGASGSAVSGNPLLIAGSDGTNARNLSVNTSGRVINAHTYLEDDAHTSGDRGSFVMGVRNDAAASFTSTDGDYSPIAVDARGAVATLASFYRATVSQSVTRSNNTTAYATGQVFDAPTSGTGLTLSNCVRIAGKGGIIRSARLLDSANQSLLGIFELWLFHTAPSFAADLASFAPSDSEAANVVAVIPFYTTYIGNSASGASGNVIHNSGLIDRPFTCAAASTTLYGVIVVRNAYVPVAQEIATIQLDIIQE